jgi:hypothetical protein
MQNSLLHIEAITSPNAFNNGILHTCIFKDDNWKIGIIPLSHLSFLSPFNFNLLVLTICGWLFHDVFTFSSLLTHVLPNLVKIDVDLDSNQKCKKKNKNKNKKKTLQMKNRNGQWLYFSENFWVQANTNISSTLHKCTWFTE